MGAVVEELWRWGPSEDSLRRSGRRTAVGLASLVLALGGLLVVTGPPAGAATGIWGTPAEIPGPGGGVTFYGVSCTGATDCTAVGRDGNDQAFYATESAGTWGAATELTAPGGSGYFNAVSCTGATDCTAVGRDGNGQAFYSTESGGTWGTPTELSAPGGSGYFYGVSCTSAIDCTAVGYDGNDQPFYATESGGTWGTPTELSGTPGGFGNLRAVSCTSATDCTAVGYDGNDLPMYATESGGMWGTPTELSGTPGGYGVLNGVSCTSATDCTAVGRDGVQPIYATESGGVWGTVTELPVPGVFNEFNGVSCASAIDCTAVGYDSNSMQAMYATESGGMWGTPTDVSGAPGGGGLFGSVSCASTADCTAVGLDGNNQPMYATSVAEHPALSLLKLANGDTGVSVPVGGPVTWTYQVTNTGNVTLSDVTVTDNKVPSADINCGGDTNVITSLAPGDVVTCSASGTALQGNIYNRGTATGTPPSGPAVAATSTANYVGFLTKVKLIKKTNGGDGRRIPIGNPITWTYTVTNTGSKYAPLTNVTVTDNKVSSADIDCGGGSNVIGSLAPGASVTCTATGTALKGTYTNLGTVTATPPVGPNVTASDTSGYFGARSSPP